MKNDKKRAADSDNCQKNWNSLVGVDYGHSYDVYDLSTIKFRYYRQETTLNEIVEDIKNQVVNAEFIL